MAKPIKLLKNQNLYLGRSPYQLVIMKRDSLDKRNGSTRYDGVRFYGSLEGVLTDLHKTFFMLRQPIYKKRTTYNVEDYRKMRKQADDLLAEAMASIKNADNREEIINGFY